MKLPGPSFPQRHLESGELLVTQEPQWVITLLGSCVAVTMFSAHFHLAVVCHAMLPRPQGKPVAESSPARSFRYLSHAIPAMAERFFRLGLQPDEIAVKMFGGGDVINMGGDPHGDRSIGHANVTMARQLLTAAQLQIKAENVGGRRGRKIVFNTQSGEVLHQLFSRGAARP